jgi:cell pole-organizing protein PopZ
MEEILASIRRIIADDKSRAKFGSARLVSVTESSPGEKRDDKAAPSEPHQAIAGGDQGAVAEATLATQEGEATISALSSVDADASRVADESASAYETRPGSALEVEAKLPILEVEAAEPAVDLPRPLAEAQIAPEPAFDRSQAEQELANDVVKAAQAASTGIADDDRRSAEAPNMREPAPQPTSQTVWPTAEPLTPLFTSQSPPTDQTLIEDRGRHYAQTHGGEVSTQNVVARNHNAGAILSDEADVSVTRAFRDLNRTVLSDNARTIEDLVREMLRPLLKAWLDDNLPQIVERLVRTEIERVARGRPG